MSNENKKDKPVSIPEQSPKKPPEIGPLHERAERGSNKLEKGDTPDLRRPIMENPIPPPKSSANSED